MTIRSFKVHVYIRVKHNNNQSLGPTIKYLIYCLGKSKDKIEQQMKIGQFNTGTLVWISHASCSFAMSLYISLKAFLLCWLIDCLRLNHHAIVYGKQSLKTNYVIRFNSWPFECNLGKYRAWPVKLARALELAKGWQWNVRFSRHISRTQITCVNAAWRKWRNDKMVR